MKISVCCGAPPLGCIDYGFCSSCRDHTDFEDESDYCDNCNTETSLIDHTCIGDRI